jgi:outer membrane lipoprotein carrier protein
MMSRPLFPLAAAARNLRALLPLLSALAIALPAQAAEMSSAETTQLLDNLRAHRAKFPSLTADFTEQKTSHLLQKPIVNQGTLSFQVPNKFRRELRGPNPSTTVSNGEKLWIYYPNFNEAELYSLGERAFFDDAIAALTAGLNFQEVARYYRYTASREPNGYRLVLTPKSGGLKRMLKELQVWVDNDFKIERTVTVLTKNDQVTTTYRDQKPTPLPASHFNYAPPAGARVSQPLGK